MAGWMTWVVVAGGLVILEMFTGTFYLLMLALGLVAGGVTAWLGFGLLAQCFVAAAVGMGATFMLRRSKLGKVSQANTARDPNVNLDIGQTLTIDAWHTPLDGLATARVMYRGAMWDVGLAAGSSAEPGQYVIDEVRGSRLIVRRA